MKPRLPLFLLGLKPLSAVTTSVINPTAAALAALAVIADSVENSTKTTLDLKNTTKLLINPHKITHV